jgi:hypothetical protein
MGKERFKESSNRGIRVNSDGFEYQDVCPDRRLVSRRGDRFDYSDPAHRAAVFFTGIAVFRY